MKKIMIACFAIAALVACNSESGGGEAKKEAGGGADLSSNPVYKEGLALVSKSDCITCHKVDEAVTGPTYRQVAEKYAGASAEQISSLAQKIIGGGTGVWGQVPMIPHPGIPQEDAEKMVKYILLLKK